MRVILFSLILLSYSAAIWAQDSQLNLSDKTDSYQLLQAGKQIAQIKVAAKFVEEPLFTPVEINITVTCSKLIDLPINVQSFKVYDYGNSKQVNKLSEFDAELAKLTVYYRTGQVHEDGRVRFAEAGDQIVNYDLSDYCQ